MSGTVNLERLYHWATMTPVNLLASLVLAVIGLVVLFCLLLGLLFLIGSVTEQLTPPPPSAASASREAPVRGWWVWIVGAGAFLLTMALVFRAAGW